MWQRLCVDLRPLNSRVIKQKYPFLIIKDCLSKTGGKYVFTFLDLLDGFHQMKVYVDDTKYFAFATPEEQYEYQCLSFEYSEAPAEFQKRILQIFEPLIRTEKVIVHIDNILNATETVKENLEILKKIMIKLKQFNFKLNFRKCKFLNRDIEFLGYRLRITESL